MALFRLNIEWRDDSKNTLVYRYPFKNDGREVNNKSTLTVRESQVAVFVYKGKVADVFEPGFYEMKTNIFPILSKLTAWKYAFENPITLDVYFVNTKQFTDIKWGTQNPIMMRDPEFGVIRVRAFGAFSFKVDNAANFMTEIFSTNSSYKMEDIKSYAKTMLVSSLSDAIGESKISALDLAGNTMEFNEIAKAKIQDKFAEIGLKLTNLFIENMSVPSEVEKALDEKSKYSILGDSTDTMMKVAAAEAMKTAAGNQGAGGAFMGAGIGFGAGSYMGQAFAQATTPQQQAAPQQAAPVAAVPVDNGAKKACPACGTQVNNGAKFCPNCGEKLPTKKFCPNCGAEVSANAKFCPECGTKLQ